MSKDFTKLSLEEAISIVRDTYWYTDVRKRIKAKAIAWILLETIEKLVKEIESYKLINNILNDSLKDYEDKEQCKLKQEKS